jgi:hypothetical protein
MNIGLGFKFNENFIFDLNVQYLLGNKYESGNVYTYTYGSETTLTNSYARGLFLNPTFIFSAGFGKWAPYGKFGIITGSPKLYMKESYYYDLDGTSTWNKNWEYTKGLSLGYQGAIGMNWKLNGMMDLYTEVDFVSLTYYPGEANLVKSNQDGVDNLSQISLSQRKTIFKKTLDTYPYSEPDPTQPTLAVREAQPFSSLSLQVGLRFSIFKKKD